MSKKLFALLLLLCSIAVSAKDVKTGDWNVIPLPQSVEVVAKPAFVINAHTTVYYPTGNTVCLRFEPISVSSGYFFISMRQPWSSVRCQWK